MFKEKVGGRKLDLILIGPLRDQSKRVTSKHSIGMTAHGILLTPLANLLIEKIYDHDGYFSDGAILLAIRPLMIGRKSCTSRFIQYQPPGGYGDIEN